MYSDSTAVVGPLATVAEPHSWDLCGAHAGRITAPRGWEMVRYARPLPDSPDEDDLSALADAVREVRGGVTVSSGARTSPGFEDFGDPVGNTPGNGAGVAAPPIPRGPATGRRRGHLRVLPDPSV